MANIYVDPIGGNNANAGTSTATPIQLFSSAAAKGLAAGGSIRVKKSGDPVRVLDSTGSGVNGTFTNKSATVTLSAAATATITLCDVAWTADNASTVSTSTSSRKQGAVLSTITVTTTVQRRGHIASVTGNLSAYTGITLWISSSTPQAAGALILDLCSDAAGTVAVNTFALPAIATANQLYPIYLDNGSALSSSVASISLRTATGVATGTISLDNIEACGSTLNLMTLISKDSNAITDPATTDGWWPIRSIVGTSVTIDGGIASTAASTPRGYSGTTATVSIYSRPMILQTNAMSLAVVGTSASPITVVGGWDFATDTQNGDTWWVSPSTGTGIIVVDYNLVSGIHISGYARSSLLSTVTGASLNSCHINCGTTSSFSTTSVVNCTFTLFLCCNNTSPSIAGVNLRTTFNALVILSESSATPTFPLYGARFAGRVNCSNGAVSGLSLLGADISSDGTAMTFNDNASSGLALGSAQGYIAGTVTAQNNGASGVSTTSGFDFHISRIVTSGNANSAIGFLNSGTGYMRLSTGSCNFGEATKVVIGAANSGVFTCQKYQDTAGDVRWISGYGTVQSDTSIRHTASGFSWKMQPNASANSAFPLTFPLQAIAVDNTATNVSVYNYRSSTATLNGGIRYNSNDLPGASSDQVTLASGAATTWQQITMTVGAGSEATGGFIPYLFAYGDASNPIYFDDASAS